MREKGLRAKTEPPNEWGRKARKRQGKVFRARARRLTAEQEAAARNPCVGGCCPCCRLPCRSMESRC